MSDLMNCNAQREPQTFNHKKNCIRLIFPEVGKIRMRKVSTRSRARPTGEYPSWKMSRMLEWESHNELNAFVLLDASPSIKAFAEQPMLIEYSMDGVAAKHYPDICQ